MKSDIAAWKRWWIFWEYFDAAIGPTCPFHRAPKSINMTHPPFQALSQRMIIQIIQQNTEAVLFSEAPQKSSNQHILHSLPILDTLPPSSSFQFGKKIQSLQSFQYSDYTNFDSKWRGRDDCLRYNWFAYWFFCLTSDNLLVEFNWQRMCLVEMLEHVQLRCSKMFSGDEMLENVQWRCSKMFSEDEMLENV